MAYERPLDEDIHVGNVVVAPPHGTGFATGKPLCETSIGEIQSQINYSNDPLRGKFKTESQAKNGSITISSDVDTKRIVFRKGDRVYHKLLKVEGTITKLMGDKCAIITDNGKEGKTLMANLVKL